MRRQAAAVLAALVVAGIATPARAVQRTTTVHVIGMAGLVWADISESATPQLYAAAQRGAVGALSVRSGDGAVTTESAGWLTLGAGNRARSLAGSTDATALRGHNNGGPFAAPVFGLGDALRSRGHGIAVDDSPAALAVGPASTAAVAGTAPPPSLQLTRVAAGDLGTLDRDVGQTLRLLGPDDTLLVVGVADDPAGPPRLHVAIAVGRGFRPGRLTSASTRRAPYVQLIDVAPTVLNLLDVPAPSGMVGQPWRATGGRAGDELGRLVDDTRAAEANRRYAQPFLGVLAGLFLLMCLAVWLALRRSAVRRGRRIRSSASAAVVTFMALLPATYLAQLVPWWRGGFAALCGVTFALVAVLAAAALAGPWRRHPAGPVCVLTAFTATVVGVDLLSGAHLQLNSLLGYSPLVAGRFAGIGNVAFGIFAAAALLAAAVAAAGRPRSQRGWWVVAAGIALVAVDGAPMWGSDFGGVLALVPGLVVLWLLVTGRRVSWRAVLLSGVAAVVVVSAIALLDYTRPAAARTHLGRFVAQLRDGEAGTVVRRKALANLHLLTHSAVTLLVPVAVLFLAAVLLRPSGGLRRALEDVPGLRAGLLATLVTSLVGFATNDSGVAVPAMALAVAVPFATAICLRVGAADQDRPADPVLP